jgi:hypothetical protein
MRKTPHKSFLPLAADKRAMNVTDISSLFLNPAVPPPKRQERLSVDKGAIFTRNQRTDILSFSACRICYTISVLTSLQTTAMFFFPIALIPAVRMCISA